MSVTLEELRRITATLYDHLETRGVRTIDLDGDYYWSIPREQRNDPTQEPTVKSIGQLSDDLEELRRIQRGETEPIGYALVWLASILREVGEQTVG